MRIAENTTERSKTIKVDQLKAANRHLPSYAKRSGLSGTESAGVLRGKEAIGGQTQEKMWGALQGFATRRKKEGEVEKNNRKDLKGNSVGLSKREIPLLK